MGLIKYSKSAAMVLLVLGLGVLGEAFQQGGAPVDYRLTLTCEEASSWYDYIFAEIQETTELRHTLRMTSWQRREYIGVLNALQRASFECLVVDTPQHAAGDTEVSLSLRSNWIQGVAAWEVMTADGQTVASGEERVSARMLNHTEAFLEAWPDMPQRLGPR